MSLLERLNIIKMMCVSHGTSEAPYLTRTRFERELYRFIAFYSRETFGSCPNGLTKVHIGEFIKSFDIAVAQMPPDSCSVLELTSTIFETFTYLCDTSNWSNDGQDPRFQECLCDVMKLCEIVEKKKI